MKLYTASNFRIITVSNYVRLKLEHSHTYNNEFCSIAARTDRYNHEIDQTEDTEDEIDDICFQSFSSCSPRYSKTYLQFEDLKEVRKDNNSSKKDNNHDMY